MSKLTKAQQERQNILSLLENINNQMMQLSEILNESDASCNKEELATVIKSLQNDFYPFSEKIDILGSKIDDIGKIIQDVTTKHRIDDTFLPPVFDNISAQLTELLKIQNMSDVDSCNPDNQDIKRLSEDVRNLTNGIITLQQQLSIKDEQVKQLYEELQRVRGENTEATKLFTAKHLIYILDSLYNIVPLSDYEDKSDFVNGFRSVIEIAEGELATYFNIEPFVVDSGAIFNPREQSAVHAEKASNPNDALHVKECQSQGYRIIDSNIIVKKASVIVWN